MSKNNKTKFKNWLKTVYTKKSGDLLSPSSLKRYADQGIKKIDKDLIELGIINQSLYNISSFSELSDISKIYWTPQRINEDKDHSGEMYKNAFDRYSEFIDHLNYM